MEELRVKDRMDAVVLRGGGQSEAMELCGTYEIECRDKDGTLRWKDTIRNTVTTQGKNHLLDTYLAGSAYTASFYIGLISDVSYTAIAAADTAAQINGGNGWTEAGPTNAPDYAEGTRSAAVFGGAAGGGAMTVSTPSTYTISETGTLKGCFLITSSTKDGTSGTLFSAGLFSGGDKAVTASDTLQVSYTLTL